MLPKVHKANNPGRPVVSSVACHSSIISKYVDYYLNPVTQKLNSYVRDTTDFINKLSKVKDLPQNIILILMDVRYIYTNIPTKEGLNAVKSKLNEPIDKNTLKTSPIVILEFFKFILTCNNFKFNGKHFLQIKDCAMGTICAPSYANIFMGEFEEKFIYPYIEGRTKLYLRYIDNIFIIWTGSEQQFTKFISELNDKHGSIKFDFEMSKRQIPFLDTIVYLDERNHIQTKLYRKQTDRQNYLHRASEHPEPLKNKLAYSQALRIKRICFEDTEYKNNTEQLMKTFISRGYDKDTIKHQMRKVDSISREEILKTNTKKEATERIPFVTTYNRTLPPIGKLLRKHWNILKINSKVAKSLNEPAMMAYKKNKNLRDILGSNRIADNKVI